MACALSHDPIDKLEQNLQCNVCLGRLRDPRTLPCLHSFCRDCLEGVVETHREEDELFDEPIREFNCPNCRFGFILEPHETVGDFPPNHAIRNILEATAELDRGTGVPCSQNCQGYSLAHCVTCEKFLCRECLTGHNRNGRYSEHSVLSMEELSKPEIQLKIKGKMYCKKLGHEDKALKFYCETCDQLICRYCMDFKHQKQGHVCCIAKEIAHKHRKLVATSHDTLENLVEEGQEYLSILWLATKSVNAYAEDAKSEVAARKELILKKIGDVLEIKSEELTAKIDEIQGDKLQKLDKNTNETNAYVKNIERYVNISRDLLDEGTDEEIIWSQKSVHDIERKLVASQRSKHFKLPEIYSDVQYSDYDANEITQMADILGQVMATMGEVNEGKLIMLK